MITLLVPLSTCLAGNMLTRTTARALVQPLSLGARAEWSGESWPLGEVEPVVPLGDTAGLTVERLEIRPIGRVAIAASVSLGEHCRC